MCGRDLCCSRFLDEFVPVSIKMAKEQGLSLNPTKISGACGRLMCCLKYEQDTYEALNRETPSVGTVVDTPDGKGTISYVSLLIREYSVGEIEVDTADTKQQKKTVDIQEPDTDSEKNNDQNNEQAQKHKRTRNRKKKLSKPKIDVEQNT